MKTEKIIKSEIDNYDPGYFDEKEEAWIEIDDDNREAVAKMLECNPKLLKFIEDNIRGLAETAHEDLVDIWRKLE